MPRVVQGADLDDCVHSLDRQGGGWCEIRASSEHPSISSVWPTSLDRKTHMIVGPSAVLTAWNGAAFDRESLLLYFTGGGHRDYGGNEVYEFDLKTGRWARLTDPSPLDFLYLSHDPGEGKPAVYCWTPDMRKVPAAGHTYDGIQFSRRTGTIILANSGAANGSCIKDEDGTLKRDPRALAGNEGLPGLYEFNPSRKEARNDLAPLTWRRVTVTKENFGFPRMAERPDGSMIIGGTRWGPDEFDPISGRVGKQLSRGGMRGPLLLDFTPEGTLLTLAHVVLAQDPGQRVPRKYDVPGNVNLGMSMAMRQDGTLFFWDGQSTVRMLDPSGAAPRWVLFDWSAAGPRSGHVGRVYSKWQYIPQHDVFVGLSDHTTGVWIYKHPAGLKGQELSALDIQALIDQAKPGSSVTIPPGLYGQGLTVDRSLTVKLAGARLWGVAGRKAVINVRCDGCEVTIEDFHAEGRKAGCLRGNCAGIKAEGVNFHLTVRRAHIDNTVMGILTDNRGGTLRVENSLIENIGLDDATREYAHGIYAGIIDRIELVGTTIRNVNGDGHLLKSRARETRLNHVRLLGEKGLHSRSIDLACGGKLSIEDSVIQHGENSDNPDIIAVGTEAAKGGCGDPPATDLSIIGSWIIVDRDRSPDERARTYGPNFLFRWRVELNEIHVAGNSIVNLEEWSTHDLDRGDVVVPDFSAENRMCDTRADCGLKLEALPAK